MAYPLFHPRGPRPRPESMRVAEFREVFSGETQYVEFKQGLPENQVGEALVAFANADGGVVLVGVRDDGAPLGIADSGEFRARIHQLIGRLHNVGRYELLSVSVDERAIVIISMDRRHEGFAQTTNGRVLVRRDAHNVALVGIELADFLRKRALARFEVEPTDIPLERASPRLRRDLAIAWRWPEGADEVRLTEHGLAAENGGALVLTVAGSLYLLDEPAVAGRRYNIEYFRYRDDSDRYDRRVTISGPLPLQVRRGTELLTEELGTELVVLGVLRYELPRIPTVVLREAIANAVAHRVYEDPRRAVRIEVRPGRVVIRSPGSLPEPVTVENIRVQNAPRNMTVISTLRRFGLAEDAGRGVDVMEDTMQAHMLAPPQFQDDGTAVTLHLSTTSTVSPQERAFIQGLERDGSLRADDRRALVLAWRGEVLTNSRVRTLLGIDSVDARLVLKRLRDAGLLIQTGERGGAQYSLSPDLQFRTPPGPSYADHATTVLRLAEATEVSNQAVRDATGLTRADSVALLNQLVSDGRLERVGTRRGTRYRRIGDQP